MGSNKEEFKKTLDAHTDQNAITKRIRGVLEKYSSRYNIDDEVVTIQGKRIHVDYLPTIDMMLKTNNKYKNSREIVGAALFK